MECKNCRLKIVKTRKFCSRNCWYAYRKTLSDKTHLRFCKKCGVLFKLKNLAYAKRGYGLYCSRSCSTRKLELNESYFYKINDSNKAYWLGFLFADGSTSGNNVSFGLKRSDEDQIKSFKRDLSSGHKISHVISGYGSQMASISISSKKLVAQLNRNGLVPSKADRIQYPIIPPSLDKDFIRGFFDGDGCIGLNLNKRTQRRYWGWSVYSESDLFLIQMQQKLKDAGIYSNINGKELRVRQRQMLMKLYKYLYPSDRFLPRKENLFASGWGMQFRSVVRPCFIEGMKRAKTIGRIAQWLYRGLRRGLT